MHHLQGPAHGAQLNSRGMLQAPRHLPGYHCLPKPSVNCVHVSRTCCDGLAAVTRPAALLLSLSSYSSAAVHSKQRTRCICWSPSCLALASPQDCVLHPVEPLLGAGLISGRVQVCALPDSAAAHA